jgi:hypothetical protein
MNESMEMIKAFIMLSLLLLIGLATGTPDEAKRMGIHLTRR